MSKSGLDGIREKWEGLSSNTRAALLFGGAFAGIIGIGSLFVGDDSSGFTADGHRVSKNDPVNFRVPYSKDTSMEDMLLQFEAIQRGLKQVDSRFKRIESDNALLFKRLRAMPEEGGVQSVDPKIMNRLEDLTQQVNELRIQGVQDPAGSGLHVPIAPTTSYGGPNVQQPHDFAPGLPGIEVNMLPGQHEEAPRAQLSVIKAEKTPAVQEREQKQREAREKRKMKEKVRAYLPLGSQFDAVLLNGMSMPVSTSRQKSPVPTVMRVKTEAILPNLYRRNVTECFVIASGYGDLASERAIMRTESFSCIRKDGDVIEGRMEGYIVGDDGKVGIRGNLVSKQGQVIAKTLMAGFLGGVSKGLVTYSNPNTYNTQNTEFGNTVQYDMNTVLTSGMMSGLSDSARMVSQFYLDMARQMFPVVEVDAMRTATIFLTKGLEVI